ncbi:unnamed protein product [Paramecium sonneborni]|uniref:Uncharacterized protein n=1 Tax=Paramecium sonneborni TaxID=65129 RepID=A0A8S1REU2_9CILI|nr:unnamed protein product [Paramecium sonneborni]
MITQNFQKQIQTLLNSLNNQVILIFFSQNQKIVLRFVLNFLLFF